MSTNQKETKIVMSCRHLPGLAVVMLLLLNQAMPCLAQPSIISLSRHGELEIQPVAGGLDDYAVTVEWAPTATGPWSESWAGLRNIHTECCESMTVSVPMFYRVRLSNPDPVFFVWIPPGTFRMGSPGTEAERNTGETQHTVTISRGFLLGKHEVTQGDYLYVTGTNPSFFQGDLTKPVENVTWHDATNYCARRTEMDLASGKLPPGYAYRLPTEAEWEYACRAGTKTAFHYGAALISGMGNFEARSEYVSSIGAIDNAGGIYLNETAPVGSYEPNAWGLYDMHGNVWEWCQDWYGEVGAGPVTDPPGPEAGSYRVLRGGSWNLGANACRSAYREWIFPDDQHSYLGFRVALVAVP